MSLSSTSPVRRCHRGRRRGFTIIEATVSLTLLIIVMVVTLSLLFSMRSFAERQQYVMAPRQAARRTVDYLSYFVEGASDLNQVPDTAILNPNALIMYYNPDATKHSGPADTVQASYDNLTGDETGNAVEPGSPPTTTKFGDIGTDLISLSIPTAPARFSIVAPAWPTVDTSALQTIFITYKAGCGPGPSYTAGDDANNLDQFQKATGFDSITGRSALLLLLDNKGVWEYFRINNYVGSSCADPTNNIQIQATPGEPPDADGLPIDVPGGHDPLTTPPFHLVAGVQYASFRVKNGNLEQKNGIFDPVKDKETTTTFATVMENVEDFQVAYLFKDGTIWNNIVAGAPHTLPGDHVPNQGPPSTHVDPNILDVLGLRVTIVARSMPLTIGSRQLTDTKALGLHLRPGVENRPAGAIDVFPNIFDHYRMTTTLMLRNRTLGG